MNFSNILSDKLVEIHGFSKEEILSIKRILADFKKESKDDANVEEYLANLFPFNQLEYIAEYLMDLTEFSNDFLIKSVNSIPIQENRYISLTSKMLEDINHIHENLINFKLNLRNVLRFIKSNNLIEVQTGKVDDFIKKIELLINNLEQSIHEENFLDEAYSSLWINVNKIKNLSFKLNKDFGILSKWTFYRDFQEIFLRENEKEGKLKRSKKKDQHLEVNFNELLASISEKTKLEPSFLSDLLYLLYNHHFIEYTPPYQESDATLLKEREKVTLELKGFLELKIRTIFRNEVKKQNLDEFLEILEKEFSSEKSIIEFLPNTLDSYLENLEKKYQRMFDKENDSTELDKLHESYSNEVDVLSNVLEHLNEIILEFEPLMSPHEDVLNGYKKSFTNLEQELRRSKEQYLSYVRTIINEKLRAQIKAAIENEIEEINILTEEYQDNISSIINKEFPELQKIRELLKNYKEEIKKIKSDVYDKLTQYQLKKINVHSIIKLWEDNFSLKRNQINFLRSIFLNKLIKNFNDLIEDESKVFLGLEEIQKKEDGQDILPLNYVMSEVMNHFTTDELRERLVEVKAKINEYNEKSELYQQELTKMEGILTQRVRLEEGILKTDVMCGVCREQINFARDKIIKCPFCGAIFHYLCVAFWLSKYNSCPSCQNKFLDPNSNLFQTS